MGRVVTGPAAPRPPGLRLVELVGPAGSGKTTVFEGLLARSPVVEGRPTLRRLAYARVVSSAAASVLATLLRHRALGGEIGPEQVRMMVYLEAVPRLLAGAGAAAPRIIVFDQGPVYFVSRPSLRSERLGAWRSRILGTWSSVLDFVVCLDAPDQLLSERINSREEWHALKGADGRRAVDVLAASRAVYEETIAGLAAHGTGPRILRFDTSRRSADEVVDEVLDALTAKSGPTRVDIRGAAESHRRVTR